VSYRRHDREEETTMGQARDVVERFYDAGFPNPDLFPYFDVPGGL
jgi:hypothetical protein